MGYNVRLVAYKILFLYSYFLYSYFYILIFYILFFYRLYCKTTLGYSPI